MVFNSVEFAIFFPIVFLLYWICFPNSTQRQNLLLIGASMLFYGWWDWRFLGLLLFTSLVDYCAAIIITDNETHVKRKIALAVSLSLNLGLLGFLKYYHFFVQNFIEAFTFFGQPLDIATMNIVLPVGISFYTFQSMSYTIDVYKKRHEASRNVITFLAFISFFPQLVAGPIERATHILPQFVNKRVFDLEKAKDGMRQILWGLFKKIVIADKCAYFVNDIFAHYTGYSGSTLAMGAFLFSMQIYGDFSGYSDMARGLAKLLGFDLMENFALPYFSRDIAEFWRKWHVSLTSWFRDYVYFPLGGSRVSTLKNIRNVTIVFLLSGFWHGANWTFIVWGLINAAYFIPLLLLKRNRNNLAPISTENIFPGFRDTANMILTFILVTFSWIFFRANTITDAVAYCEILFSQSLLTVPVIFPKATLVFIFIFIAIEWLQRDKQHGLDISNLNLSLWKRWSIYIAMIFIIFWCGGQPQGFIYFQF